MSSSSSIYASRKRRKPVQKSGKGLVTEGAKSNPSKRHRDRLNAELERLASLLPFPQDVVAKLDKLSVLRLSVSYLRAKSFFNVSIKSNKRPDGNGIHENCRAPRPSEDFMEGELLLQALNGFVLVITAEGLVFYTSSTIQDYLGFHQSDIIHQSVFELIHTEDRGEFRRQIHWALNPAPTPDSGQLVQGENSLPLSITHYNPEQLPPENSPFLERNFVCRLRCLLDNSSGFLAMNFQGRLKFLYEQNRKGKDGSLIPPQLGLFAIATPLQPPSILEIRTKNFIFRTKHKLDFTPIGCDAKGKLVLGYTDTELCMRGTGYQFIHAADMMYCAENHVRMMKTGESGMTVFRLLTKENGWTWVQANARLGYKNGRPDYIIATQRALTAEEGEEHLRKRALQLPFNFATGEALLYEGSFSLLGLMDPSHNKIKVMTGKLTALKETSSRGQESIDPSSLLGAMLQQDRSVYVSAPSQNCNISFENICNESKDAEQNDIVPSDWEDVLFSGKNRIGKKQPTDCIQDEATFAPAEENLDFLANNIGSDLYNTMKSLGIGLEDFDLIQRDETFLRVNWDYLDEAGDINDISLNEEILTYVQESLKKRSDCMYSSCMQQKPLTPSSSCMVQQQVHQEQKQQKEQNYQQHQQQDQQQQQQHYYQQQQLCQKMKHMQVNGPFANWNPGNERLVNCQQQFGFSGLDSTAQEVQYKSELSVTPSACQQDVHLHQQLAAFPAQPSNLIQTDFPISSYHTRNYTTADGLEDYLYSNVQQNPQIPDCSGANTTGSGTTQQAFYAGDVTMYPCENDLSCINPVQLNPAISSQQQFLAKIETGYIDVNSTEIYPSSFNNVNYPSLNSQPLNHHPGKSTQVYSNQPNSGFM
ncbi:aryl hydrocarbon receptor 1a isoform X2 [Callorhinchus milii]|uniref:aryl hydrocarbon receptor 1a isoform X2 n=1 Tax=Callorhinchus milii TaxID=7868 RepID=UPI001C3F868E|nr:aryl hydrocarbon receptor 1a isoform X2 [Callorhinchus milii]